MVATSPLVTKKYEFDKSQEYEHVKTITMNKLIGELEKIQDITPVPKRSNWIYAILLLVISIGIFTIVIGYYQFRKWLTRRRVGMRGSRVTPSYQMAPMNSEGEVSTYREVVSSAPLYERETLSQTMPSSVPPMYPTLRLREDM